MATAAASVWGTSWSGSWGGSWGLGVARRGGIDLRQPRQRTIVHYEKQLYEPPPPRRRRRPPADDRPRDPLADVIEFPALPTSRVARPRPPPRGRVGGLPDGINPATSARRAIERGAMARRQEAERAFRLQDDEDALAALLID